ncbi:hypothetical protein E2C01_076678 [Portunus trituberculatus]|uniref:Uncharacterized protein n=1 Tax=Portunus trituberculatus TaxID=210409 RepID=A0A5B7IID5_PORTR|nr:hypothetical protein [Portunus trituberculatus]
MVSTSLGVRTMVVAARTKVGEGNGASTLPSILMFLSSPGVSINPWKEPHSGVPFLPMTRSMFVYFYQLITTSLLGHHSLPTNSPKTRRLDKRPHRARALQKIT